MFKVGDTVRLIAFENNRGWERAFGGEIGNQYLVSHVDSSVRLTHLNGDFAFFTRPDRIAHVNPYKKDCIVGCEKENKHDTCHVYNRALMSNAFSQQPVTPLVKTENLGSVKHDQDKVDPTFLTWELVEEVCKVRAFGAKKYGRNNYKITGFKFTRSLAAALRHIFAFLGGQDNDPESGYSHLAHAVCCLEHCLYDLKHHKENDDRKSV